MRILRLTALRSYLILSKNIRKSLIAINIGIFLSIFAATAAIISIVIEKKITDLEFELIESQNSSIEMERFSEKLPIWIAVAEADILRMRDNEELFKFFKNNEFIDKIISRYDLYLPQLFDLSYMDDFLEYIDELNEFVIYSLYTDTGKPVFGEEKNKEYKKLLDDILEYKKVPISKKEKLNFYERTFHTSYLNLVDEIVNDSKTQFYGSEEIDFSYGHIWNFSFFIKKYFLMLEDTFRANAKWATDNNKILNEKIINLSKAEKNIIFFAFVLQFIIFIIIQFFEISSVASQKFKRKAKK